VADRGSRKSVLKDRFGLSWQVTPRVLADMLTDPDRERARRVTRAFLSMSKFDIAVLRRAFGERRG